MDGKWIELNPLYNPLYVSPFPPWKESFMLWSVTTMQVRKEQFCRGKLLLNHMVTQQYTHTHLIWVIELKARITFQKNVGLLRWKRFLCITAPGRQSKNHFHASLICKIPERCCLCAASVALLSLPCFPSSCRLRACSFCPVKSCRFTGSAEQNGDVAATQPWTDPEMQTEMVKMLHRDPGRIGCW